MTVSLAQVLRADKNSSSSLQKLTRDGIQVTAARKPLDNVFDTAMQHPDVLHVLQPTRAPKVSRVEKNEPNRPPRPYETGRPNNRKGKGKGRGGTGSTANCMPAGFEDGVPATKGGNPLCFDFNFGKGRCPQRTPSVLFQELPRSRPLSFDMSFAQAGRGLAIWRCE